MGRPSRKRVKKATAEAPPQQTDDPIIYSVLYVCFDHAKLNLKSLARVATTGKKPRQMVQLFLQQNAHVILPGICNKASELHRKVTEKYGEWSKLILLLKWFCSMVGREALQADAITEQALLVRKTPYLVARTLIEAGLRVTYQQLVAAAYKRAEGLEVWVVPDLCKDLPPLVHQICNADVTNIKKQLATMQPEDLPDMLVFAVDMLTSAPAETVLSYIHTGQKAQLAALQVQLARIHQQQQRRQTRSTMQKQLQQHDIEDQIKDLGIRMQQMQQQLQSPELIQKLLTLAVARRHALVLHQICQLEAAKQVPAADVAELLQRAVSHKGPQVAVLDDLMVLLANSNVELSCDKVTALLQLAVQRRNSSAVYRLIQQPAAQQIDTETVVSLLRQSVHLKDGPSAEHLCYMPAAQDISSSTASELLDTAVHLRSGTITRSICTLPSTTRIPEADYAKIVQSAIEQGAMLVLFELVRCRAGQALTSASVASLFEVTLSLCPMNDSILGALCDYLPAADGIDRQSMRDLLLLAIRDSHSAMVHRLCLLHPAVDQLTTTDVVELFHTALEQRVASSVPPICQLAAAGQLPVAAVCDIMAAGLEYNKVGGVLQIYNGLPVQVQQLDAGQVSRLLRLAMQAGAAATHVIRALTQLPAAREIPSDDLLSLFRVAMRSQAASDAGYLLLQSATDLSADTIKQLIREVFVLDKMYLAGLLLKMPKAQELNADAVADLLSVLLEQTKTNSQLICSNRCLTCPETEAFRALCALPASQHLQPDEFAGLVHTLMKLPSRISCGTAAPQHWLDQLGKLTEAVNRLGPRDVTTEGTDPSSLQDKAAEPAAAAVAATAGLLQLEEPAAQASGREPITTAGSSAGNSSSSSAGSGNGSNAAAGIGQSTTTQSPRTSSMVSLMSAAVLRYPWSLKTLCSWPPAQKLSTLEIEFLLFQALTPPTVGASQPTLASPLQLLSKLSCCERVSHDSLARFLMSAVKQGREEAVKYLSRVEPASSKINTETVLSLLHAAIQLPFGKAVHYICHMEGAKGMKLSDVSEVLRMNEEMGFAFDVNTLRGCLYKAVQQPCGGAYMVT